MANYRGKLSDPIRKVAGVQAVAYRQDHPTIKVDTDVTDANGIYEFSGIPQGPYIVRFYGRDWTDEDRITIFVAEVGGGANIQYLITPLSGTAIKNSTGTLSLQLQVIDSEGVENVIDGDVKLYIDNNGTYELLSNQTGVVGDDYSATSINATAIDESLIVYAVAAANDVGEFVYDTVTLADISDGSGFVGWVTSSTGLATVETAAGGTFDPATITLTPNFAINGSPIANLGTDPNFSFTATPNDTPAGVSVNATTGVVTITCATYFASNNTYTAE